METPVTFESEGQQVVGMLHLPEGEDGPVPAVLFLHGFTGNMQEPHRLFVQTARALAEAGIGALRFDFRGSGDSAGAFRDVSISSERADAQTALDYLRRQPLVDAERIGMIAMSLGGVIAAGLLGEDPRIKAAAFWCAVAHTKAAVKRRKNASTTAQLATKGSFDMDGWEVGRRFVEELADARPVEEIKTTSARVLLLHGDRDESVPVGDAALYEEALRAAGREVERHILKGAGHTFDSLKWISEIVALNRDWFQKHL